MISAFVAALIGVMAAQASPGPNMMAVAGAALKQGRSAALLVVSGIATGSLVWAALTAFGLGELFRRFPHLLTALMFLGGAYLLWLAVRSLLSAWRGEIGGLRANAEQLSSLGAWWRGLLVVLTNPKASELGRFTVTEALDEIGAFKTSTLRNVAVTAPFMPLAWPASERIEPCAARYAS